MKKKNNAMKNFLAAFLAFAMVFSMMPTGMTYVQAEENAAVVEEAADDIAEAVTETETEAVEETAAEAETEIEAEAEIEAVEELTAEETTEEEETEETVDPEAVKLQIQYGEDVYKITEAQWAEIREEYEDTYKYSTNHRSLPVYGDEFTGVTLDGIMEYLELDTEKLNAEDIVTFRADDGNTMTKLDVEAVFYTDRYCYTYDEEKGAFVEDENMTEAPIIITSDVTEANDRVGRLIVGMSAVDNGSGEFVKQYWWNGLFNTAENQFISIEIPVPSGFASGTGTAEDPYMITNAEELQNLADKVNAGKTFEGEYVKLANDIDLTGIEWTPIGGGAAIAEADENGYDKSTPTNKFLGTFDGAGYTIKNLTINADEDFVGLFGHNGGTVKNFTVEGKVTVTGNHDYVSAVVGFNSGTITRVINKAEVAAPDSYNIGGIAGTNVGNTGNWKYKDSGSAAHRTLKNAVGIITECGNEAKLTGMRNMGGIVGTNFGEVSYCYNYGDIDFWWEGSMSKIGGIAGVCADTDNASWAPGHISNCYNTGYIQWINTVQSSKGYGGIVCFIGPTSSITNCYNIGAMKKGRGDQTPICPRYDSAKYIINNYSLDTLEITYMEDLKVESLSGKQRSEEEFKSEEFLAEIGGAYTSDVNNLNNGFPVLKWQNGEEVTVKEVVAGSTEIDVVEGQTFSDIVSSLELYVVYSDGTKEYIPSYTYTTKKTDAFTTDDDGSTLTISCSKGTVDVTVNIEQRTLNYIRVWTQPTKYAYAAGEEFDPTGMKIYAYYTNELLGSVKYAEVTDYTWTTGGKLTETNNTVTVYYTCNGDTASVAFDVVVVDCGTTPETDANGVYQLATAEDLVWFSKQVSYLGNTAINAALTADIDVSATEFCPIGDIFNVQVVQEMTAAKNGTNPTGTFRLSYAFQKAYTGTFDGNGYSITLDMNRETAYAALFGNTNNATIQNLTVKGNVSGTQYVAGIKAYGPATITNCINEATITATSNYAGGISANGAITMTNCVNKGDVTGLNYVGGLNGGTATKITDSGNEGTITATSSYVGGISGSGVETLNKVYNTGDVTGKAAVGGIVGYSASNSAITNSYNTGDITATAATSTMGVGGIVGGKNNYTTLKLSGCYSTGNIVNEGTAANAAVGELIGYCGGSAAYMATITNNNFFVQNEEGTKTSVGVTNNEAGIANGSKGVTLAELSEKASVLGNVYQNSCGGPVFTTQTVVEHVFGEWSESTATFTESGTQTRTCEGCGKVEEQAVDATGVADTIAAIEAIGEVTLESKEAIEAAREAYEALTEEQKAEVTNLETLETAEVTYAELVYEDIAAGMNFEDVTEDNWYQEYVEYVYVCGLMNGMTDTYFGANEDLTRAQFATILYRIAGEPEAEYDADKFADVAEDTYYANAVMWANEAGIVNGVDKGVFDPNSKITREQMVAMMHRLAVYMGAAADETADITTYPDYESVDEWAKADVEWAVATGLISGTSDGTLSPTDSATRAQCAKIITVFMGLYE